MQIKRTFDLLENYQLQYPDKPDALAYKVDNEYKLISTKEYIRYSYLTAYGLLSESISIGDHVITISNNRPEWNYIDMALSMIGAVHVPVYPTISDDDYTFILNQCHAKLLLVSDIQLYTRLNKLVKQVETPPVIYILNEHDGINNFKLLINKGADIANNYKEKLEEIKKMVQPDDVATMIYTSGTTGNPKGVMLTHANLVANFTETVHAHNLTNEARSLSILPLNHIYERGMNYHYQLKGIGIYYAENMASIAQNLKEVKPHIFTTVPRLIERVYDKIIGKGKGLSGIKKAIFFWAVNCGMQYQPEGTSWLYNTKRALADRLVFRKWREALGGQVEIIVTGGAAIQERLLKVFGAANIQLIEGYGLTETSPVIAVNFPSTGEVKFGTVGPVLNNVQVKIADDGEILCKGPSVMKGYFKRDDLTREVIDNKGWFHTGDIGTMIDGKYLKITDRKKEIFKLSSGKYIAPQILENKLKESFFIEQVMVIGENEKFASAIISPNFTYLHDWCYANKIQFRDNQELIDHPEVLAIFQREVGEANSNFGQTEQIKRFRLITDEWSPQSGELSPTLKLKRKVIANKYQHIINAIYAVQKEQK